MESGISGPTRGSGRQGIWHQLGQSISQHVHAFVSAWEIPFFTSTAAFRLFHLYLFLGSFLSLSVALRSCIFASFLLCFGYGRLREPTAWEYGQAGYFGVASACDEIYRRRRERRVP